MLGPNNIIEGLPYLEDRVETNIVVVLVKDKKDKPNSFSQNEAILNQLARKSPEGFVLVLD